MDNLSKKREAIQRFVGQNADVQVSSIITAGDVMTAEPECLSVHVTALDLVRRFHATGFRHLLLADEQNLLAGVVSDRDVIRCFGMGSGPSKEELQRICASELMSDDLITVERSTPLDDVVGLLVDNGISCLPVLDDGRLVGIITNTDLFMVLESFLADGRKQASLREMAAVVS